MESKREFIRCGERSQAWAKAPWAVTIRKADGGYWAFESHVDGRAWDRAQAQGAAVTVAPAITHELLGVATEANGVFRWTCSCGNSGMPMFEEASARAAHERHVGVYAQKAVA